MDSEIPGDEQARRHHVHTMSGQDQPENGAPPPLQEPGGQVGWDAPQDDPPPTKGVRWIYLDALPESPKPRQWIVPGFIPAGCLSLLYGPGGAGKTLLAMMLAVCIACDLLFFGKRLPRNIRPVLYLCEDDVDEFHRRMEAICRGLGVSFREDVIPRIMLANQVGEPDKLLVTMGEAGAMPTYKLEDLRNLVLRDGERVLFIVDPLVKIHDGQENDRFDADAVLTCLERTLCHDGSSALVLGHPSKSSHASGSSGWTNAARSVLLMGRKWWIDEKKPDRKDPTQVAIFKGNYASADLRETIEFIEEGESGWWRWIDHDSLEARRKNENLVIDIIRNCQASEVNLSPKPRANKYIVKVILEHRFNQPHGKRIMSADQIENLLDKLRDQRRLVIEEYRNPKNRGIFTRWTLSDDRELDL